MRRSRSWVVLTCKSLFTLNTPSRLTQTRCYGRWDTPQHVLLDEEFTEPDGPNGPVWRGKDYANERVMEYTNLDKPFEDMFDRTKVPRMPWYV